MIRFKSLWLYKLIPLAISFLLLPSIKSTESPASNLLLTDVIPEGNNDAPLFIKAFTAPASK